MSKRNTLSKCWNVQLR